MDKPSGSFYFQQKKIAYFDFSSELILQYIAQKNKVDLLKLEKEGRLGIKHLMIRKIVYSDDQSLLVLLESAQQILYRYDFLLPQNIVAKLFKKSLRLGIKKCYKSTKLLVTTTNNKTLLQHARKFI